MTGLLIAWVGSASAQSYVFPAALDDYGEFYPTAYVDHGGVTDWNCGSTTYSGHRGNDFGGGGFTGMDEGRTIVAGADGTVIGTNDGEFDRCTTADCPGGGGFGNYVHLQHADGKTTWYAHLKQFSVAVSTGDVVSCGQVLGEMGSSGFSTGPHLHFEVRNSGNVSEDPFDGPCSGPPSYWTSQGAYEALPDPNCGPPPACEPAGALACGETRVGSNDDDGSASRTWNYGCSTGYTYSGPELSFTFSTPLDEPVTLAVTGLAADLDLYVLDSPACDGTGCVASSVNPEGSDETVTFDAAAGQEYVVVLDGFEGAVSDFSLEVGCVGTEPVPTDTGSTVPTGDTATGTDDPDDTDDPEPDGPPSTPRIVASPPEKGCGCGSTGDSFGTGAVAAVFLASLLARSGRYRRRG
jgi:murein DD-endopeptidase MepM/ murein hydrolase activator NlpD